MQSFSKVLAHANLMSGAIRNRAEVLAHFGFDGNKDGKRTSDTPEDDPARLLYSGESAAQ